MPSTTQKVLVEVRDVEELLAKAADASSHAAMWFCDIADLERYGVNEQYTVGDAARLLGIATAAKWDADGAVQEAERAIAVLLAQYQMAEGDAALAPAAVGQDA